MGELTGKHIVVTGSSAGIGAELCRLLGAEGCRVVLSARRVDRLAEVADDVRQAGGEAYAAPCDVTQREQVFALAQAARAQFGEIDVWVSNAGAGMRHRLLDAGEEDMLNLYKLNCLSSLWAYQAVAPAWIEAGRGGQIIDVASIGSKSGFALGTGYCAAKHGLSAIGDVARQELVRNGILATTVYPGLTTTEFSDAIADRMPPGEWEQAKAARAKSRRGNFFLRKATAYQSAEEVARSIVQAVRRPAPLVYPHRWAALATLIVNLWPGVMLKQMKRRGNF
jgi:short-subunit dehydrogenase